MKNPYSLTTAIFVIIALIGAYFLGWRDENFAFILLLYFIVTLGIKLDEIAGQIGMPSRDPIHSTEKNKNIIEQLTKINTSLDILNKALSDLVEKKEQKDVGYSPIESSYHTDEQRNHRPENTEE